MYLGMVLVLLGLVFGWGNSLSWVGVVGYVAYITRFQIIPEEKVLKEIYGERYIDYCGKVRRWL